MTQTFTLLAPGCALLLTLLMGCSSPPCPTLVGRWTTREGQDILFQPGGKALWLTQFGSTFDSMPCSWRLDCRGDIALLDLTDFRSGAFVGKTLFAIIGWSSDSSFRLRYAVGLDSVVRPRSFDSEQAMIWYLKK